LAYNQFNIALNPFFFVRSGRPAQDEQGGLNWSQYGHFWTAVSTVFSEFDGLEAGVNLDRSLGNNYYGFSLRCLAIE